MCFPFSYKEIVAPFPLLAPNHVFYGMFLYPALSGSGLVRVGGGGAGDDCRGVGIVGNTPEGEEKA